MKQIISTDNAPKPAGPYSQAVVVGDLVFVAGQVPRDPQTGQMAGPIEDQTRTVLSNIKAILEAAGSNMSQVVRVDVYLSDMKHFDAMNGIYKTFFNEDYPVRTTVGVQLHGFDVEINCIAHKQA
ncbi:MAG TPA: Rid family detoxifying hydrolase [Chloroflexia bacterium]|nr:Rid family detoxifying hydrolase [Chloroflexia bacterium]